MKIQNCIDNEWFLQQDHEFVYNSKEKGYKTPKAK